MVVGGGIAQSNPYENTLNAAYGYEKKSLKCVIKSALQKCTEHLMSAVAFEIDTDIKSTPI